MWVCLYDLQMPRPPVVYLLPGNGSRGCLSIAIRRSALAQIYRSGRCETIRPRDQESQPDTSNASVNVFLLVTGCAGALKCAFEILMLKQLLAKNTHSRVRVI
jgi:hypothetical protein